MRQANKDMTRILFGVILLALSSTIVCFFAAWAANEAAKDTRPDSDGKLKTVGGDVSQCRLCNLHQHLLLDSPSRPILETVLTDGPSVDLSLRLFILSLKNAR